MKIISDFPTFLGVEMRNLILPLLIVSVSCQEDVSEPRQAYGPIIQDAAQVNDASQFQQKGKASKTYRKPSLANESVI